MATRRSNRISENEEKKENEQRLKRQIGEGTPDGLAIIDAGRLGRGVATLRKYNYKEGEFVALYEGQLIAHKEAVRRCVNVAVCPLPRLFPGLLLHP